ncbi:glycoside hydrolase family 97 protein [Echinicola soli]|uniref:Glycoside hydrolase family 97 protein n=1 Tax=Echinicola soli TaxID=2591634 RepID=A0A514CN38_9BACT|nr:glycoside hydrolase family 97 protein [Echinicola soli]QDH81221.1 glycoside hydrolase family 97 protein [Echinicola soli]
MRKTVILTLCLGMWTFAATLAQQSYQLRSPDRSMVLQLTVGDEISYALTVDGQKVVENSAIELITDQKDSRVWKVGKKDAYTVNRQLSPVVWQKSREITDHYNALHLRFKNGMSLQCRLYDNGAAWRWTSSLKGEYKVIEEKAEVNLGKDGKAWYPEESGFFSHNERAYKHYDLTEINGEKLASLPALFEVKGTKVLLTESDLFDYAGMWIKGSEQGVQGVFPHYPKEKKVTSDRDEKVIERADYIAKIEGKKDFPWRILMIAREDKELLTNQLVYQLARPSEGDFSWVKPGKVQWDWWHYNNVYEVPFRAGINTETYKYYIDFAAEHGIEYVLFDEGWCDTRDLMDVSSEMDMEVLTSYAQEKGVGLILWASWLVLDKQLDMALDKFSQWGIKGIKVDFMQRDDQDMVNYYEKVSRAAAKRKMLVDFHGAYKPTGWLRTYPNVLTSEGVLGNEISKFAGSITPDHTTTLPFTRMAAGPMDFTPGGMRNVHKEAFKGVPAEPMTLGTRCNQLAMYVVFESPLQMLCDIPTHYYQEPEAMEFLSTVPVEWAETIPLQAKIGDYVALARKAPNGDWYIGAMTDSSPRELEINFSFLPEGSYTMEVWKDGINADRNAKDFAQEKVTVNNQTVSTIKMSKGGGWVARISGK